MSAGANNSQSDKKRAFEMKQVKKSPPWIDRPQFLFCGFNFLFFLFAQNI